MDANGVYPRWDSAEQGRDYQHLIPPPSLGTEFEYSVVGFATISSAKITSRLDCLSSLVVPKVRFDGYAPWFIIGFIGRGGGIDPACKP